MTTLTRVTCPTHGPTEVRTMGPSTLTTECGAIVRDGDFLHPSTDEPDFTRPPCCCTLHGGHGCCPAHPTSR
jgi:hypothetical protein